MHDWVSGLRPRHPLHANSLHMENKPNPQFLSTIYILILTKDQLLQIFLVILLNVLGQLKF